MSVLQIVIFLIGLINQDPSRVSELQQIQTFVSQALTPEATTTQPITLIIPEQTQATKGVIQLSSPQETVVGFMPTSSICESDGDMTLGKLSIGGSPKTIEITGSIASNTTSNGGYFYIQGGDSNPPSQGSYDSGIIPVVNGTYNNQSPSVIMGNVPLGTDYTITLSTGVDDKGQQITGLPITIDTGTIQACR